MAELNDFLLGLKFKKWTLAYLWITVVSEFELKRNKVIIRRVNLFF